MKISNASLVERIKMFLFEPKARIEIVSLSGVSRKFAYYVAEKLSEEHSGLKVIDVYRTNDLYNFDHPFLWGRFLGYVISIPKSSDLVAIKKTCIGLETDILGLRTCDIDVYETRHKKISRADLGYKKW